MKKFLFYVALFGTLFISSCSDDLPVSEPDVVENGIVSADISFRKAQDLFDSFRPKVTRGEESRLIEYPENYGGCYIDEEGELHVYITTDFVQTQNDFKTVIGMDGVKYEKCLYSRNELMNLKRQISEYILQNQDAAISKNINHVAYSAKRNRVIVGLRDYSDANVNAFKSLIVNSPAIEFIQANTVEVEQSNDIASGQEIVGTYVSTIERNSGSVGYKAYYGSSLGFVTACHVVETGDTVSLPTDWSTNIAVSEIAMHYGTVDASFCKMSSGWNMLLNVYGETFNPIVPFEGVTVEGAYVKKYGYNGYTDGWVVDESYDANISGVYMMDLAKATYASAGGDSGGLILSGDNGYVMGIHQSGGNLANYCKVGNINYMLGLTLSNW
jgi:hypothetical protein